MEEESTERKGRIIYDWDYKHDQHPAKEGDEWLNVYVPYVGTYGCIDIDIENYLLEDSDEYVRQYIPDASQYDEIDIHYEVYLGDYNEAYVDRIKNKLNLSELHLEYMSSPQEYNFTTDKLIAQITKDDMWKLYESVKDTKFYKHIVEDATACRSGYIPYYREEDFYFSSKDDWSDGYDHPAILGVIMEAALHDKLEMSEDDFNVKMELYMDQADWHPITDYCRRTVKSLVLAKGCVNNLTMTYDE